MSTIRLSVLNPSIASQIDAAASENYFLTLGLFKEFRTWFSINNFDNLSATFRAFAGFSAYNNWFHNACF